MLIRLGFPIWLGLLFKVIFYGVFPILVRILYVVGLLRVFFKYCGGCNSVQQNAVNQICLCFQFLSLFSLNKEVTPNLLYLKQHLYTLWMKEYMQANVHPFEFNEIIFDLSKNNVNLEEEEEMALVLLLLLSLPLSYKHLVHYYSYLW